jgi:hypothetical protein
MIDAETLGAHLLLDESEHSLMMDLGGSAAR